MSSFLIKFEVFQNPVPHVQKQGKIDVLSVLWAEIRVFPGGHAKEKRGSWFFSPYLRNRGKGDGL